MLGNKKAVIAATVEEDDRLKTGDQLEKSVFLEKLKDLPEISKAAKFFSRQSPRQGHGEVDH